MVDTDKYTRKEGREQGRKERILNKWKEVGRSLEGQERQKGNKAGSEPSSHLIQMFEVTCGLLDMLIMPGGIIL